MECRDYKPAAVSQGRTIEDKVIENLLDGQQKAASAGDFGSFIKISKYIMKLANKRRNELIYIGSEVDESDTNYPPD